MADPASDSSAEVKDAAPREGSDISSAKAAGEAGNAAPADPTPEEQLPPRAAAADVEELESVFTGEDMDRGRLFAIRRKVFQDAALAARLKGLIDVLPDTISKAEKPSVRRVLHLKLAFGHWVLGRAREALALLESLGNDPMAKYLAGVVHLEHGHARNALTVLQQASEKDESLEVACALLEAKTKSGEAPESLKLAEKLLKSHPESAEVHFQRGLALEHSGDYEMAIESYQHAQGLEASHVKSAFHLGYLLALRGQEEEALRYYRSCMDTPPFFGSVLLNLGLLYEDARQYEKAIACYQKVLRGDPAHPRARLFLKDALASLHMYYDEDQQTEMDRRKGLLKMPVAEFELSVRCRSALESIGIQTLGDLVAKTDVELLACDNFGETSLQEIKVLLAQHSLHLGMSPQDAPDEAKTILGQPGDQGTLDRLVSELDLSVRSRRCMERLGIVTLRDLAEKTEKDLLSGKNFGRTSLKEIKDKLAQFGLKLADDA
ncbi:MAG: tetratricopeptide repeat protein [Planctomycetes bacterium]|nr:tetratricopeptide repeat protein [Planctomycetota bacterium]